MRLSAIVAMSKNRIIGHAGKLPWHLSEDLKRFKALTMGHPIIMGRKTYESIGRVLPGRQNIILTRSKDFKIQNGQIAADLDAALGLCSQPCEEAFIIGGSEIYKLALPRLNRIYLTLIQKEVEGDTAFPDFSKEGFVLTAQEDHLNAPLPFSFMTYDRQTIQSSNNTINFTSL